MSFHKRINFGDGKDKGMSCDWRKKTARTTTITVISVKKNRFHGIC